MSDTHINESLMYTHINEWQSPGSKLLCESLVSEIPHIHSRVMNSMGYLNVTNSCHKQARQQAERLLRLRNVTNSYACDELDVAPQYHKLKDYCVSELHSFICVSQHACLKITNLYHTGAW